MYYSDGSVYEGEWFNGMKNGQGMLRLGKIGSGFLTKGLYEVMSG